MNGDHGYRFGEAEHYGSASFLLSENECEVLGEPSDEYQRSNLVADYRNTPDVSTDPQTSAVRFMTSHSDYAEMTLNVGKGMDWSHNIAGRADTMRVVGPEKTGQLDNSGIDNEMSDEEREEDGGTSLRCDADETESTTQQSELCEGREEVDWSELASARAALQSSDDGRSSLDSDDEESELLNLMTNGSTEMNNSDHYEKDTAEGEECDQQPQETQKTCNLIVNENCTFEKVCVNSSTHYVCCSDEYDGRGSCYYFHCADKDDGRGDVRMQAADDVSGEVACSCCNYSPPDDDDADDDDDDDVEEEDEPMDCSDSTADWYHQQIVDAHSAGSALRHFYHQPATPNEQQDNAAVAEEETSGALADDDTAADMRTYGEHAAAGDEWQADRTADHWSSSVPLQLQPRRCQSSVDDVHNCWAACGGGCYDDGTSAFYNYERPPSANIVDLHAPTLSGVHVCGPPSFELLFLIDQLASSACLVDEAALATLLQNAASSPVDGGQRITELLADDVTAGATADDDDDDGHRRLDTDVVTSTPAGDAAPVDDQSSVAADFSEFSGQRRRRGVGRRHRRSREPQRDETDLAGRRPSAAADPRRRRVADAQGVVCGSPANDDVDRPPVTGLRATGRRHRQQRTASPPRDAGTSTTASVLDRPGQTGAQVTSLRARLADDARLLRPQQLPRPLAGAQRDRYSLPDVFVDRMPPPPAAAPARRPKPTLGRGLHLPPVKNAQQRVAPRVFPAPPERRRSHPLAPRRPTTPPNRNVLATRAVWPSMASGRPMEDEWTRRAAAWRRRTRLPPVDQTATVAAWQ